MEHIITLGITLFTAFIFVICGTSIVKNPHLLSNYNSFTEEEKASPEFQTYLKQIRGSLLISAGILVAGQLLSMLSDSSTSFIVAILIVSIALTPYLFYWQAKVSKRMYRKSWIYAGLFMVIILVILGIVLIPSFYGGNVSYDNHTLRISGIYGVALKSNEIKTMTKEETIPQVTIRTNGLGLGYIRKGFFRATDGKTVRLMLTSNDTPVLHIQTIRGENIYVNTLSSEEMDKLIASFHAANP